MKLLTISEKNILYTYINNYVNGIPSIFNIIYEHGNRS